MNKLSYIWYGRVFFFFFYRVCQTPIYGDQNYWTNSVQRIHQTERRGKHHPPKKHLTLFQFLNGKFKCYTRIPFTNTNTLLHLHVPQISCPHLACTSWEWRKARWSCDGIKLTPVRTWSVVLPSPMLQLGATHEKQTFWKGSIQPMCCKAWVQDSFTTSLPTQSNAIPTATISASLPLPSYAQVRALAFTSHSWESVKILWTSGVSFSNKSQLPCWVQFCSSKDIASEWKIDPMLTCGEE